MTVRGWLRLAALASAVGLILASTDLLSGLKAAQGEHGSGKLEGSWNISITGTPFRILRTVTDGGVVDAYAFPPFSPTAGALVNSGGHGNWKKIGPQTYAVTVLYFQLNPALNPTFNILDTVGKVVETIQVSKDGQTYTSVFSTTISFPDGTLFIVNSGATSAQRITVEPLP
jgi:hypothetical protein